MKGIIKMKSKKVQFLTMMISAFIFLSSCGSVITQADLDAAYQQGYSDGHSASDDNISAQNYESEKVLEEYIEDIDPTTQESTTTSEAATNAQPSPSAGGASSIDQPQPETQGLDQSEVTNATVPDILSVIATMQASAPVIDTSDIIYNEGTAYESYALFMPGDHIGEYNGVQVDRMLNLSSRASQEKYYVVTDDLKNVENSFRNAYNKTWLELGYTNCIPAIRYDSRNNKYGENPYDMVHPGWEHTYAVLYVCTWSDGTPRCGVYYISVSNNTDQEVMAILCPITSISDGLNMIC